MKRTHNGKEDGVIIPSIVFTKGGALWLDEMGALDCNVIGLDWTANLSKARAQIGHDQNGITGKALQGNLDPNVLFAPTQVIQNEVEKVLNSFGKPHTDKSTTGSTHIFNLGHGISQHTPPENVAVLVDAVHSISQRMRA